MKGPHEYNLFVKFFGVFSRKPATQVKNSSLQINNICVRTFLQRDLGGWAGWLLRDINLACLLCLSHVQPFSLSTSEYGNDLYRKSFSFLILIQGGRENHDMVWYALDGGVERYESCMFTLPLSCITWPFKIVL